ncbi:MAG: hypothetical protein IH933_11300 [Euryarchaeota archaeon]|nr:hypothetical protein [Euryarchaeota archaeon]
MSQNPIGTITDEKQLVELRKNDRAFSMVVPGSVRPDWLDVETELDWRPIEGGDVPRLLVGRIDPEDREAATEPRTPTSDGEEILIEVPPPLVGEEGLELDPDAYDADNPLLLETTEADDPVTTDSLDRSSAAVMDEALLLTPTRFSDGTPYHDEPVSEVEAESDPIAEAELEARGDDPAPQSGAVSAPIDAEIIEGVVNGSDVDHEDLVSALETIARQGRFDPEDTIAEYGPFTADNRVIGIVDPGMWVTEIAADLDLDTDSIEAAKRAHNRQAETLLRDAGPKDYYHAEEAYDAIVTERPTTPATE